MAALDNFLPVDTSIADGLSISSEGSVSSTPTFDSSSSAPPPPEPVVSDQIIPVDSIVNKTTEEVPAFVEPTGTSALQKSLSDIKAQALSIQEQIKITPEPQEDFAAKALALSQSSLADEKEQIRVDADIVAKEARARELSNRIIERDRDYQTQLEELELNKSGQLSGALQGSINDLQRERSREIADLSFAFNVANGDFLAAQEVVDNRIKDMEDDRDREIRGYEMAFNFAQNDMTESEKLQANQLFAEKQAAQSVEDSKEIARYNFDLQQSVSTTTPPEVKNFGTAAAPVWKQFNSQTQTWEDVQGIEGISGNNLTEYNTQKAVLDRNIERVGEILGNTLGIQSSTGALQQDRFGGFFTGSVDADLEGVANLFKFVPIIGNILGSNATVTQKGDVLAAVSFIVNNATFDKLVELKQGGATFGSLSDPERVAIGKAASDLAASAQTNPAGEITGFSGSQEAFENNMNLVLQGYEAASDQLAIEFGLTSTDTTQAQELWNK